MLKLEENEEEKPAWTSQASPRPHSGTIPITCTPEAQKTATLAVEKFSKALDREALRLALTEDTLKVTDRHFERAYRNLTGQTQQVTTPLEQAAERFQFGPAGSTLFSLGAGALIAVWQSGQIATTPPLLIWTMAALSVGGLFLFVLDLAVRAERSRLSAKIDEVGVHSKTSDDEVLINSKALRPHRSFVETLIRRKREYGTYKMSHAEMDDLKKIIVSLREREKFMNRRFWAGMCLMMLTPLSSIFIGIINILGFKLTFSLTLATFIVAFMPGLVISLFALIERMRRDIYTAISGMENIFEFADDPDEWSSIEG